jgi:hypothetical protein
LKKEEQAKKINQKKIEELTKERDTCYQMFMQDGKEASHALEEADKTTTFVVLENVCQPIELEILFSLICFYSSVSSLRISHRSNNSIPREPTI